MSRNRNFWTGIGVGAGIGAAAVLLPQLLGRSAASRVVRLEKSIQVGRPVEETFNAWVDFDRLPRVSDQICSIRHFGKRSHWIVNLAGRTVEWDALTEQYIPNQSIGWKSVSGPKHTGRITFAPVGTDTLVHVTMNYAPPSRIFRPLVASAGGKLEGVIEKVLRDFKASVERRNSATSGDESVRTGVTPPGPGTRLTDLPRTGTFGGETATGESRFPGSASPADYSSPPDAKR